MPGSERLQCLRHLNRALRRGLPLALLALLGSPYGLAETLKISVLSPEGSVWTNLLRKGASEIETATEGRVQFRLYPGGVMGDDKTVMRKIRLGQLHGAVVTATALVQRYPDIALYNLPMLFRSSAEVDHVRARMDSALMDGLAAKGFIAFGLAEVGFAYALSREPISTVADARRQKVWTPDNDPASAQALAAFGITPIPLPIVDVLGGLQTGVIDCVAAPPVGAIALQWHTRTAHVLDLPLLYVYGLLALEKRRFQRLADADQAVVRRVMSDVVAQVNARSRRDHESAVRALIGQGLERRRPEPAAVAEWRRLADLASERMVEGGWVSGDLHARLRAHLKAFRDQPEAAPGAGAVPAAP